MTWKSQPWLIKFRLILLISILHRLKSSLIVNWSILEIVCSMSWFTSQSSFMEARKMKTFLILEPLEPLELREFSLLIFCGNWKSDVALWRKLIYLRASSRNLCTRTEWLRIWNLWLKERWHSLQVKLCDLLPHS